MMTDVVVDPGSIERASDLMWVAHNLERTADRAVNICERVIFTVTGEMKELDDSERGLLGVWPAGLTSSTSPHRVPIYAEISPAPLENSRWQGNESDHLDTLVR